MSRASRQRSTREQRTRAIAACARGLLLGASLAAALPAHAARVVDLRFGSHPGYARIVIETDAPAAHEVVALPDATPDEVAVRIAAASDAREIAAPADGVASLRLLPQPDGSTLARIRAPGPVRVETQALSEPARVVLDLRRGAAAESVAAAPEPAAEPRAPAQEEDEAAPPAEEELVMPAVEAPIEIAAAPPAEEAPQTAPAPEAPPSQPASDTAEASPETASPAPPTPLVPEEEPPPVAAPPPPPPSEAAERDDPGTALQDAEVRSVALWLALGAGLAFLALALARRRRAGPAAAEGARAEATATAPASDAPPVAALAPEPLPEREPEPEPLIERELESELDVEPLVAAPPAGAAAPETAPPRAPEPPPEPEDATLLDFVRMQNRLDRQLAEVVERLDEISRRLARLEASGGAQVEELASHRAAITRIQRSLRPAGGARPDPGAPPPRPAP